jgi:adenosylcobinamide-phosphate synthase
MNLEGAAGKPCLNGSSRVSRWKTAMVEDMMALALGFLLDQLLGDPPSWPHPVRWIGKVIHILEPSLRRFCGERLGGIVLLVAVAGSAGCCAWGILELAGWWHPYARVAVATVLIYYGLAARSLAREAQAVLGPAEKGDLAEARKCLGAIVGRDTNELSAEEINRACIETVAENTTDGVVAPLFYAGLAGPVGMWVYKAINTLDSMVGYRNARYLHFGWASARMDDLANYLPARLTYLIFSLAAGVLERRGLQTLRIGWRDGRKHPSPNSGWAEAAMAGALGLQLGGPSTYGGILSKKPLLGDPTRPLTIGTVRRAIRLMLLAGCVALLVAIAMRLLIYGIKPGAPSEMHCSDHITLRYPTAYEPDAPARLSLARRAHRRPFRAYEDWAARRHKMSTSQKKNTWTGSGILSGSSMTAFRPNQRLGPMRPIWALLSKTPNSRFQMETAFSSMCRPSTSRSKVRVKPFCARARTRSPDWSTNVPSKTL